MAKSRLSSAILFLRLRERPLLHRVLWRRQTFLMQKPAAADPLPPHKPWGTALKKCKLRRKSTCILLLLLLLLFSLILGILLLKLKPKASSHSTTMGPAVRASERPEKTDARARGESAALVTPNPECGGPLQGSEGSFSSPNYPSSYPPGACCLWHIEAAEGLVIRLKIETLSVEAAASCRRIRGAEDGRRKPGGCKGWFWSSLPELED
ncbi:membrane frizzled-related protein-like isoform X2 [Rhinatrema bivittatum]|uniref:membrane frizzled-related protein-like isoform X2 n=1 Tax=Rhinatrema bivittatum TaxID=194408 RepID=UPI00112A2FBC|nr:membrane frizzled-related protein-like isoform X2 [Rhinatrema bivittatum]